MIGGGVTWLGAIVAEQERQRAEEKAASQKKSHKKPGFNDHANIGKDGKIRVEGEDGKYLIKDFYDTGELYSLKYYNKENQLEKEKSYYSDGSLSHKEYYKDGKKHGTWYDYWFGGDYQRITEYENGVKHGRDEKFNFDGHLKSKTMYLNGKRHGLQKLYYGGVYGGLFEDNWNNDKGEVNWKDGKLHGKEIYWDKRGKVIFRVFNDNLEISKKDFKKRWKNEDLRAMYLKEVWDGYNWWQKACRSWEFWLTVVGFGIGVLILSSV